MLQPRAGHQILRIDSSSSICPRAIEDDMPILRTRADVEDDRFNPQPKQAVSDYEFKDNKVRVITLSGESTIEDLLRSGADLKIEEKGQPLEDGRYRHVTNPQAPNSKKP